MKSNCPTCGGVKSVSEGPYHGLYFKKCHRCGWKSIEERGIPLRAPAGGIKLSDYKDMAVCDPDPAMLYWLGKYGVSWQEFTRYGNHATEDRLLFQCSAFYALRSVTPGAKPKWLTHIKLPLARVTRGNRERWGWWAGGHITVVCEDSLGAFKAFLAGLNGFPLLGTNSSNLDPGIFHDQKVLYLADPDEAGIMAARRMSWLLRGVPHKVYTDKEPKEYQRDEISRMAFLLDSSN